MGITVDINNTTINLRAAVIMKTPEGFVFEQDKNGFLFPIGGRIKTKESSFQAAFREIHEKLRVTPTKMKYRATLENFFEYEKKSFHEICIIYKAEIEAIPNLPKNFKTLTLNEIELADIRPSILTRLIYEGANEVHFIQKDP